MDERFFISLCILVTSAGATCNIQSPYFIKETDPNGTIILSIAKDPSDSVTFKVKNISSYSADFIDALQQCFSLTTDNTTFTLQNTKPLDLEEFFYRFSEDISAVNLEITCGGTRSDVTIGVQPVNEFSPYFVNSPYTVPGLKESTTVDTVIYKLKPNVGDRDVGKIQNYFFSILPYAIKDYDGREFFAISAPTQGNITLIRQIDYDVMITHTLVLNLSVADGQSADSMTANTILKITIQDVDDQAPYFAYPDCHAPCPAPQFETITNLDYTGILKILPRDLLGMDDDSLGTQLLYTITYGNQHNVFAMDVNTGVVTQKRSVNEANLSDAEFRLVLEVRKNLSIDLYSIAILTVKVRERMGNDSGFPTLPPDRTPKEDTDSSSSLLIPLIILSVALAVVLLALIIVLVIYSRKQSKMTVGPVDDKSEPQTEEEDLHTETEEYNSRSFSNEKLVFGHKTTLGIITDNLPSTSGGRGNQLPPLPLRDSSTETTEGMKKKRSRRRHKNKETEIFDGTREYNMGLDPEFFDSTDKSKVKRSQRSRKTDSVLPIQVPNDNPADADSRYS